MTKPLVLHCLDGLGVGGAEEQLILLLRHMPRQMFDHVVCHVGPSNVLASHIRSLGISVYDLSGGRRYSLLALLRLLRLAHRLRPSLIHADHSYGKLYGRIAARVLGIPLLATVGMAASQPRMAGLPRTHIRPLRRLLIILERAGARRFTDHYLAISQAVMHHLIRRGVPAERISVVYRGMHLEDFPRPPGEGSAALRRRLGVEEANPILLNVGRLIRRKGQETIIRAMPAVRRRYPRATLLLAGDGPLRAWYQDVAASEGVADAVHLLGTRRDIPQLLQLADLFVFPSLAEGTGVALLEAMAASRPCVVTDLSIFREVLGSDGAGSFVPPERADLLADALLDLLEDPDRRAAMGQRAREIVETRFNIRHKALEFALLCQRVIASRHPAHPREVAAREKVV